MSQKLLLLMATAAAAAPPLISIAPKAIPAIVNTPATPSAAESEANYTPSPSETPVNLMSSSSSYAAETRYRVGYAPGESATAGDTAKTTVPAVGIEKSPWGWANSDPASADPRSQPIVGSQPVESYSSTPVPVINASHSSGTVYNQGRTTMAPTTMAPTTMAPTTMAPTTSYPGYSGVPVESYPQGQTVYYGPTDSAGTTVINYSAPTGIIVSPYGAITAPGFDEYFRFDVTPEWVSSQWEFVTACVGPVYTQGYRVSLVTGTAPDDLTGVLTYYFDSNRKVHQIVFQGTTGDLGRLTQTLARKFQMAQKIVNDPSLVIYENPPSLFNRKNYMEARKPLVIQRDQKYHRYEVYLSLNRPKEKTGLFR